MKRLICNNLLLAIVWLLFAWAPAAAAQSPAVVTVEPAKAALPAGETTTVKIRVEGAADLFGVELHLFYDPAVLEILDGDASREGVQLVQGSLLDPEKGFTVANSADNLSGELDYAITLLAPAEAVSGNGVIVSFGVRALADGSTPLTLSAILASAEGASLPVTIKGGHVVVGAGPSPATPTGSPPTPGQSEPGPTRPATAGVPTATSAMQSVTPEAGQPAGETGNNPSHETPAVAEPTTPGSVENPSAGPVEGPAASDATGTAAEMSPAEASPVVALPVVSQDRQEAVATGGEVLTQDAEPISPPESSAIAEPVNAANDNPLLAGGLVLVVFLLIASVIFLGRRLMSRK